MPVVEKWNHQPAIIVWIKNRNQRVKDNTERKIAKLVDKHIFEQAVTANVNNTEIF